MGVIASQKLLEGSYYFVMFHVAVIAGSLQHAIYVNSVIKTGPTSLLSPH